jgi:hypothetical protein
MCQRLLGGSGQSMSAPMPEGAAALRGEYADYYQPSAPSISQTSRKLRRFTR